MSAVEPAFGEAMRFQRAPDPLPFVCSHHVQSKPHTDPPVTHFPHNCDGRRPAQALER
jgi:hypothetical protein